MTSPAPIVDRFTYQGFDVDGVTGEVTCRYATSQHQFTERFIFGPEGNWDDPATSAAIRILYLLAGISYYKTTAPPLIDLGHMVSTADERDFLLNFYREGLGEFAYRNGIDLAGLEIAGPDGSVPAISYLPDGGRPLIPFGGGIDSIVTVEALRRDHPDAALFVVHPQGQSFAAIEDPAAVTSLPMVHVTRVIDPKVLRSRQLGFLNGHVPITAVITATALVAAVLSQRDAVVLSNEWSASIPTLEDKGRPVNHQWSKSESFEKALAQLVERSLGPRISVFSYLRCRSELWVAQKFAALTEYHPVFRSCNRAFHQDPAQRLDHWCGECDKCCFIDLILAPFLSASRLNDVFDGREPLNHPALRDKFDALLGLAPDAKPFECVGDVHECRAALQLTAGRADRHGNVMVPSLIAALSDFGGQDDVDVSALLAPIGPHYIPDRYAPPDLLVRAH
jgi:hypothetical protein